jgi:hypothetical protein
MKRLIDQAPRWEQRAAELRQTATTIGSPAREVLLETALEWETLARRVRQLYADDLEGGQE